MKDNKQLREDKELMRLASLVGTDAKNPKEKLAEYISNLFDSQLKAEMQKFKQEWRKERKLGKKRSIEAEYNAKRKKLPEPTKSEWERRATGDSGNEAERC
jgi:hypothetical protein